MSIGKVNSASGGLAASTNVGINQSTRHHIRKLNLYKHRRAQHRRKPTLQFHEVKLLNRHTAAQKMCSYHAIFHVFNVSNPDIKQLFSKSQFDFAGCPFCFKTNTVLLSTKQYLWYGLYLCNDCYTSTF
jgi:hypothetical protein